MDKEIQMKMFCWVMVTLLVFATAGYAADWLVIKDHSKVTIYADPDFVRAADGTLKMRNLWDYKDDVVVGGITFRSNVGEDEFDCQKTMLRPRSTTLYSEYMGTGKIIESTTKPRNNPWEKVEPKTGAEVLWKYACGGSK
jgi:hypothetical protein